jgi:glyoxylase-like metal-dependent hydrolase (beta-lactamase superfamily II)
MGLVLALFALLVLLGLLVLARAPDRRGVGDFRLRRLAEGVYIYRGYFSNSAVLVLSDAVVVVDTQVSPGGARRMRAEIEKVTSLPIRYVINTHYHGDHTGGNAVFPEAEIIATEETARFVAERDGERVEYAKTFGLEFQEFHPTVPPTRTFRGRLLLEVGSDQLEIVQLGSAETPDACVVHWPARRMVACGDGVATWDYPYLGVPFMDEGLRDDGEWIGFLRRVGELRPRILIPGHGPPLSSEAAIANRLRLLVCLFSDLLAEVKVGLAACIPIPELVKEVDAKLGHYRKRRDLCESSVSQRFAIYRSVNNLLPERKGKGWWHGLRPSIVERASPTVLDTEWAALSRVASTEEACSRAMALANAKQRPLAISLLEKWTELRPDDSTALATLADVYFGGAAGIRPSVDATEYVVLAIAAAKRALAITPSRPLALLTLGCAEVLGGLILAQPMQPAIAKLETALEQGTLSWGQKQRAFFFLGIAHQMEHRPRESDRWYRRALPSWARPLYPLVRERVRVV